MNDRTVASAFATVVLKVLAIVVGTLFLNPLRTASSDPIVPGGGYVAFKMPSTAMEPTIHVNDRFLVSLYQNGDPVPGDIVVFQYPIDRSMIFVKRVIAGGGSKVEIHDGITFINGKRLDEPYVDPRNNIKDISRRPYVAEVPADAFFVMGDNRDNSDDSRYWGSVPRSHIVGKVVSVSAPNNRSRGP